MSVFNNTLPPEKQVKTPQIALPDEVIALAEQGVLLFPIACNAKTPLVKWMDEATSDQKRLEAWALTYPNCNWAARTGPESGFFAVDIDAKNGKNGFAWFNQRVEEHGTGWFETREVSTPSGGRHLHFAYPAEFKVVSRDSALAPGVDLKGEGGYVLVPNSQIGKEKYRYDCSNAETDPSEAPQWLVEEILAAQEQPKTEAPKTNGHTKYAAGERHSALMTYAGKLRNTGMDFEDYKAALISWDVKHNDPPLGREEVTRQADSYKRFEQKGSEESKPETGKIKELLDIPDILTRVCIPPVYVIPAINLCRGSICQWVGRDGIGKSWLGLAAAVALATGGEFLGMTCEKMPVLYLDYQNPDHEVSKRALLLARTPGPLENLHVWGNWCEQEPAKAGSPTLLDIAQKEKPVIIVDPFVHFHNGKNENHPDDMVPVMCYMRKLVTFGATILFFHHSPLVDEERGRGTLAIRAECELAIVHTKKNGLHSLQVVKNRFGAPKTIEFDPAFEEGRFTARSAPEQVKQAGDESMFVLKERIADLLEKYGPMNQSQICKEVADKYQATKHAALKALEYGIRNGRFKTETGKDNAKIFTLCYSVSEDSDSLDSKKVSETEKVPVESDSYPVSEDVSDTRGKEVSETGKES